MIKLDCANCRNTGAVPGPYDIDRNCPKCDGHGHFLVDEDTHFANRLDTFLSSVRAEAIRARNLFPGRRIMGLALAEEFGELIKAGLDESTDRVMKEAIQTACMCARFAIEGDESLDDWRVKKGLGEIK